MGAGSVAPALLRFAGELQQTATREIDCAEVRRGEIAVELNQTAGVGEHRAGVREVAEGEIAAGAVAVTLPELVRLPFTNSVPPLSRCCPR